MTFAPISKAPVTSVPTDMPITQVPTKAPMTSPVSVSNAPTIGAKATKKGKVDTKAGKDTKKN